MVPTLSLTIPLEELYIEILFTLIRLRANPHTQEFVPEFEELEKEWWTIARQQKAVLTEKLAADLAVELADNGLNALTDEISGLVLIETKGNRSADLFVRYYGTKRPSVFRRPVLGEKLDAMRTWPPSLLGASNPALQASGSKLDAHVKVADAAVEAVTTADQKSSDFRIVGTGKQYVDKCNGARKGLHGKMSQLVHTRPELGLTRDFPDSFFMHESKPRPPRLAELDQKIASAEAEVARLKALRAARVEEDLAEANAKVEAEKKLKRKMLEVASKKAAEAAAHLAALQAELGEDE